MKKKDLVLGEVCSCNNIKGNTKKVIRLDAKSVKHWALLVDFVIERKRK